MQAAMCSMHLPSFFVVGPPRTGTSWLHEVLSCCVNLPSPTKETRFFDLHFQRGMKWYRAHFPTLRSDRPIGEVAPTYFASSLARERIAQTAPGAKLIFIFRDPVERVVSLYRIKRAYGMLPWSIEEALVRDPELIESGLYATRLQDWQTSFPPQQLLITIYDDLRKAPQSFVDRVTDFIGIPKVVLSSSQLGTIHSSDRMTEPRNFLTTSLATTVAEWCKARRLDRVVAVVRKSHLMKLFVGGGVPFAEVSEEASRLISNVFLSEVEGLETLLDRSLSDWKRTTPECATAV